MKILLTGGSGLIGSMLGQQLVRDGHKLIVVSRDAPKSKLHCPYPASHLSWGEFKQGKVPVVDAVIHLAGEPISSGLWTSSQRERIKSSRVNTTLDLVHGFQTSNITPSVWINASAIGFYGNRSDEVLDEKSSKGAGFLSDVCEAWESALKGLSSQSRLSVLRFGVILSPRGGALGAMLPAFRAGVAGALGSGKQWLSWIHIADVVQIIRFALNEKQVSGVFNVVAPNPVTNLEFSKTLGRILSRPVIISAPRLILKSLGEFSSLFLDSQKVTSAKIESIGFKFAFSTLDAALNNILDFQMKWGVHEIFQEQWIPRKIPEIFPFFCDEMNLERLTPPLLNFKVAGKSTSEIQEGTLIDYKLKIRGFPAKWRTKIIDWQPNEKFVDTQLKGPYKLWHHTHEFIQLGEGTLMRDRVLYELPIWPLGNVMLPLIQADVKKIFEYRRKVIVELFCS